MNKKNQAIIGVSAVTSILVAVYMFGVHHGRTGEILTVFDSANAADSSPVKALDKREALCVRLVVASLD